MDANDPDEYCRRLREVDLQQCNIKKRLRELEDELKSLEVSCYVSHKVLFEGVWVQEMKDDKRNSDQNFEDSIIESEDKFNSNEDLNVWYDLRTDIKEDFEKVTSIQGDLKEDIKRVISILNNQGESSVKSED